MSAIIAIILPVFLVILMGYLFRWRKLISDGGVDGLMKFTQGFAIPCLLFRSISHLDLSASFEPALMISFYTGALSGFAIGMLGARYFFGRDWEDSVAIGFLGLFSNSLLLGLPIMERAFGPEALIGNFAIIAVHAPLCYMIGITAMEIAKAGGTGLGGLPKKVAKAMFSNALVIGISLGVIVNLTGLTLPATVSEALDLVVRAALPAALFGLGGVLFRYRPEGDIRVILFITSVSLVLHPMITWGMGRMTGLDETAMRSAIVTASMAPGINSYLFANMYDRAKRVAASGVLIGTALSIISISIWITLLP